MTKIEQEDAMVAARKRYSGRPCREPTKNRAGCRLARFVSLTVSCIRSVRRDMGEFAVMWCRAVPDRRKVGVRENNAQCFNVGTAHALGPGFPHIDPCRVQTEHLRKLVGAQARTFARIAYQRSQTRATGVAALAPVLPDEFIEIV